MENDHDLFQECRSRAGLGLAVAATATPALAKQRAVPAGHDARAQAVPGDIGADGMSGHRATAIRECNAKAAPFSQSTWGNMSADQYRACMAEHGEAE